MTVDVKALRALGLNIFPARPEEKRPAVRWKIYQDTKCEMVIGPDDNAVVLCGRISGNLFIVDFDAPNTYPLLEKYHGKTFTVKTYRGYHMYFRWPDSSKTLSTHKWLLPGEKKGIDIRAERAYALAPGSRHPDGGTYELIHDAAIMEMDPRKIFNIFKAAGYNGSSGRRVTGEGSKEGNRNENTFRYLCMRISEYGIQGSALRAEAERVNAKNEPPLPDSELDTITAQAAKYATPGDHLTLADVLDYGDAVSRLVDENTDEVDIMRLAPQVGSFGVEAIVNEIHGINPFCEVKCGGEGVRMRHMQATGYGHPMAFNAMIISAQNRRTYVPKGKAECPSGCSGVKVIKADQFESVKMPKCSECHQGLEFQKGTKYVYKQTVILQELLEESGADEQTMYEAVITGDDVFKIAIGRKWRFMARFRSKPDAKTGDNRISLGVLGIFPYGQTGSLVATEEDLARWRSREIYKDFIDSFTPRLLLPRELKEAMAFTLRGGHMKPIPGIDRHRIHICLMGEAATGKSTFMEEAVKYLPGASFRDATNASPAGLTIGMDNLSDGTRVPRAGALPLHHGSVLALDEIDKMDIVNKNAMLLCMEQGKVTMTKTANDTSVPAETAMICGGNPKGGKFKQGANVADAFGMSAPFLSRFDTAWLLVDPNTTDHDRAMIATARSSKEPPMGLDEMQRFVIYTRTLEPEIPPTLWGDIDQIYLDMREAARGEDMEVTPRQHHGLYRQVAASAALHLREVATMEDVEIVKRVTVKHVSSLAKYELVPTDTGTENKLMAILRAMPEGATEEDLAKEMADAWGFLPIDTAPLIDRMHKAGRIEYREGKYHAPK